VVQTSGVQEASGRAEPKRRALGEGAAQAAPTAPHATPRTEEEGIRTGPERFWAHWPVRVALASCLVISGIAHCSMMPLNVPHRFELKDVDGDAVIPVDLLAADDPPPPPPPPPAPSPPEEEKEKEPAPNAIVRAEVAKTHDAGVRDGAVDAPADAPADVANGFDGEVARAEAGFSGPRDPEAIVGASAVRGDVVLVKLVINAEVIRSHPVGARMGYLLRGIPQWDEFMNGTDIDPIRDTDWVMIIGPSLVNTSRDTVLIHYSVPDAVVDRAVRVVSRKYDRGGPFDAGVRGVKATLMHADRAERVILRPQPHLLAVVPPNVAERNARVLVSVRLADPDPTEAMFLRVVDPHHPIPEIPESITEMRMRVVPSADAGAEVFVDGDTKDADAASQAAEGIRRMVRRHDDAFTSLLTHGLFDHVEVSVDGRTVKAHLTATRDQIETLVTLVGDFLGLQPVAAPVPTATSSALPRSPSNLLRPR
jgi:hypothetical protein